MLTPTSTLPIPKMQTTQPPTFSKCSSHPRITTTTYLQWRKLWSYHSIHLPSRQSRKILLTTPINNTRNSITLSGIIKTTPPRIATTTISHPPNCTYGMRKTKHKLTPTTATVAEIEGCWNQEQEIRTSTDLKYLRSTQMNAPNLRSEAKVQQCLNLSEID